MGLIFANLKDWGNLPNVVFQNCSFDVIPRWNNDSTDVLL